MAKILGSAGPLSCRGTPELSPDPEVSGAECGKGHRALGTSQLDVPWVIARETTRSRATERELMLCISPLLHIQRAVKKPPRSLPDSIFTEHV